MKRKAKARLFDDDGHPTGGGWDELLYPDLGDPDAYALEIEGKSFEPVYRAGDRIIISPAAKVRPGSRVVLRTKKGDVHCRVYLGEGKSGMRFSRLNGEAAPTIPAAEVKWVHAVFGALY